MKRNESLCLKIKVDDYERNVPKVGRNREIISVKIFYLDNVFYLD